MYSGLALLSSLMWGTGDFLGGLASRRLPALAVYGLSQAIGFVVMLVIATLAGAWGAPLGYWPWAILAAVLGLVGMLSFYRALAIGPMGIVSPLAAVSVLVPVAFALLVRGEQPNGMQILGMILAFGGILLASGPELTGAESARPILLGLLAALMFGGMYIAFEQGSEVSPVMTMTGMRLTSVAIFIPILIVARGFGGATWRDAQLLVPLGVADASANVLYGIATTHGLMSTISVLGSLYPVVTAVLAAIFLRERLRAVQYVGVVGAVIGILLISAGP